MRTLVATALLLVQFQPILGVALCRAMGGAEENQMEAGCPMPEAGGGNDIYLGEGWSSPNTSHECVFAEACATPPNAVRVVRLAIVSVPAQYHLVSRPSDLFLPTVGRSPPVPPPRP
jgi:hypothetical protein